MINEHMSFTFIPSNSTCIEKLHNMSPVTLVILCFVTSCIAYSQRPDPCTVSAGDNCSKVYVIQSSYHCCTHSVCRVFYSSRSVASPWSYYITKIKWCPPNMACKVRFSHCILGPCPPPRAECVPKVKLGVCPVESPITGLCTARCDHDADCPGNRKCCGSCPRVCKVAISAVKNGVCPKLSQCPESLPSCPLNPHCSTDRDCTGARKCCGSCPRMCIDPVGY